MPDGSLLAGAEAASGFDWGQALADEPKPAFDWGRALAPNAEKLDEQEKRMAGARQFAADKLGSQKEIAGVTVDDIVSRLGGGIPQFRRGQEYQEAEKAYQAGTATDEQLGKKAEYELLQARESGDSTSRTVARAVARAPGMVGEALLGGPALRVGAAGAARLGVPGAAAATRWLAPQAAGASILSREGLAQAGKAGLQQAAATPAMPGFWLAQSQDRAVKNGGHWYDPENVAPALAQAALNNALLGQLGQQTKGLGLPARLAAGGGAMPLEQQAADAIASVMDDYVLSDKYKTDTKYGTLGHFLRGEKGEGWKSLATQATLGAGFAAFHGKDPQPVLDTFKEAVDSVKDPAQAPKAFADGATPEIKAYQDAVSGKDVFDRHPELEAGGKPLLEEMRAAKEYPELASAVPEDAKPIGKPNQAFVYETTDGQIVRVGRTGERADIPEMLQATSTKQVGKFQIETLPKVDRVGDVEYYRQHRAQLEAAVEKAGYRAVDLHPENVGEYQGKPVFIDPGAVRAMAPGEAAKLQEAREARNAATQPDTRGQGVQYHGAREPVRGLSEGYYNPDNIYGGNETFYTTDARDVAAGYGRKKPNAVVYQVREKAPVKFYDMESPQPAGEVESLFGDRPSDLVQVAVDAATKNGQASLREVMDEIRAYSREYGHSKDEVQEIFDIATQRLQRAGYGGMRHVGGRTTGKKPHEVKIYLRPHEQIDLQQDEKPQDAIKRDLPASEPPTAPEAVQAEKVAPAAPQEAGEQRNLVGEVVPKTFAPNKGEQITLDDALREHVPEKKARLGNLKQNREPESLVTKLRKMGGLTPESAASLGLDVGAMQEQGGPSVFQDVKGRKGTRHIEDVLPELVRSGDLVEQPNEHLHDTLRRKLEEGAASAEGIESAAGQAKIDREYEAHYKAEAEREKELGIDFDFGHNVADKAEKMLADQMAGRTLAQGGGTAAKANFGQAQAKEAGRSFARRVGDWYRSLGGQTAPAINRDAPDSADRLAQYAAAHSFTAELTPRMIDKVLPDEKTQTGGFRLTLGAVLTEMRLRFMRHAYLDQAAKAYAAGDAEAGAKHNAAAQKVKSVVGQPVDGDVLKNPIYSEADYQRESKNPDVLAAIERWKEHMVPFMDEQFKAAEGLDPADDIPSFTQIPGMPVNIKAWKPGSGGEGVVSTGGEPAPAVGGLNRARLPKLGFARRATGASEGYHLDVVDLIQNSVEGSYSVAAKARMLRQLAEDGLAQFAPPGKSNAPEGFAHEIPNVKPPKGTQPAKGTDTSLWFKDETQAYEVYKALGLGRELPQVPLAGWFNLLNLRSLGEVTAHSKNLLTMMVRPGMRFRDLATNLAGVIRGNKDIQDRIVELARIGAVKPKGFESQMEGETVAGKIDPLKYTGKFLDIVDRAVRLTAESAFKRRAEKYQGIQATEGALRDFINQGGNYNKRTQNWLVQLFRQTGVGPFATAGTTFYVNGLKALTGGHGLRTTDARTDALLRAEMLGRTAAVVASGVLANILLWGRADGDDNTPLGAVKVGTKEGKTQFFDLTALTGLTRGTREIGVQAVLEGQRAGAKKATAGDTIDKAAESATMALLHPFEGPFISTLYTAKTGKDLIGRQVAAVPSTASTEAGKQRAEMKGKPETGESQTKYNLIAAGIHANPVLAAAAAVFGWDPAHKKTTAGEELMRQMGPYGIKVSGQPPGAPHRTITVPVKVK